MHKVSRLVAGITLLSAIQRQDSVAVCLTSNRSLPFDFDLSAVNFSTQEVYTLLNKLDVHKAYGTENLSPHILKQCAPQLSPSLAILFTLSMKTGKVSSQWKASNVVPIFKKGDKGNIENYRPVSLLSCVSKIMERCIFNHNYVSHCRTISFQSATWIYEKQIMYYSIT